jgi:hypothetical protein
MISLSIGSCTVSAASLIEREPLEFTFSSFSGHCLLRRVTFNAKTRTSQTIYDDKLQALRPRPVHDWTSHTADAFRYLALTLDRKATLSGFYRRIEYPQHGVV